MKYDDELNDAALMTVSDAAKFLGVGKKIIYQLIDFEIISAVRERGAIRVEKQSLQAFYDGGYLT